MFQLCKCIHTGLWIIHFYFVTIVIKGCYTSVTFTWLILLNFLKIAEESVNIRNNINALSFIGIYKILHRISEKQHIQNNISGIQKNQYHCYLWVYYFHGYNWLQLYMFQSIWYLSMTLMLLTLFYSHFNVKFIQQQVLGLYLHLNFDWFPLRKFNDI